MGQKRGAGALRTPAARVANGAASKGTPPAQATTPPANSLANERARLLVNAQHRLASLPAAITELGHIFTQAGHELALVGGPVRDAFLGLPIHDFDLTTSARPQETEKLLSTWGNTWDIGREFGTIGARRGDITVEVTTYRNDHYDIGSRKPAVDFGDTLEGDLTRRDFTVNAMAVRLPELTLVDPCGGLDALLRGELDTPVSAAQSFDDDPLRIMRAARFAAQLSLDVSEDVMRAMRDYAPRLEIVSAERIRAELERLIIAEHPRRGIELLVYTGVADVVLPEISNLRGAHDEHGRHKDVYEHSLQVLDNAIALEDAAAPPQSAGCKLATSEPAASKPTTSEPAASAASGSTAETNAAAPASAGPASSTPAAAGSASSTSASAGTERPISELSQAEIRAEIGTVARPDFVLRFAALMHDVGKPATRKFEADGTVTFRFHDVVGARMTTRRMKQLRFDKQTIKDVSRLVELHLRAYGFAEADWTDSAVRRFVRDAGPLLSRLLRLIRADITSQNKRRVRKLHAANNELERRIVELRRREELDAVRPDLDGNEIMEILGIAPGRQVGKAYQYLLGLRLDEGALGKEEAERRLRAWWEEQEQA
ncbi:HDIG domain-containing metalloprotein [Actinobaculum suis]|uniref:HDIG domain-containing metalloprotein n=1 Tax=Actinobaculum suis TaxID=1657 RepID=UPI0009F66C22|nr:HDIG domain-containing metalloprotein [Actinobaculum suis]